MCDPQLTEFRRIFPAHNVALLGLVDRKSLEDFLQCDDFAIDQAADLPQPKRELELNDDPVRCVDRLPAAEAEGVVHKREKFWAPQM